MKLLTLEDWLNRLGLPHSQRVKQGDLPDLPLEILFEGFQSETCLPLPGVELEFSTEPSLLKCVHVNVISTFTAQPSYQGPLPGQLQQATTRQAAIELLGRPYRSQPPFRLPEPAGHTGGWDAFIFDDTCDPPLSVMLQYTANLQISDQVYFQGRLPTEPQESSSEQISRAD